MTSKKLEQLKTFLQKEGGGGGGTSRNTLVGGAGNDTLTSLAAAVPTGGFEGGAYDLAMAPTTQMTDIPPAEQKGGDLGRYLQARMAEKEAEAAATSSIAMGGGPPIVSNNNQVINNNSNVQMAAKDIANTSPLLNAVNFAT